MSYIYFILAVVFIACILLGVSLLILYCMWGFDVIGANDAEQLRTMLRRSDAAKASYKSRAR